MSQAISELAQQGYGIQATCQAFGLPRASYYRQLQKPKAKPDLLRSQVQQVALDWSCSSAASGFGLVVLKCSKWLWTGRAQVQQVALDWSCYGYRRITHELKRQGIQANHKRVLRLMREENLVRRPKKRFVATTNSDHRLPVYPNLAAEMDITAPDQLWVSDLTYIRLGHEFIYLAVVLDACSRRCLGWSLGRRLEASLATKAILTIMQRLKAS